MREDRPLLAFAWTAAAAVGFSSMAVFVKFLSSAISRYELVFFRSFINLILVVAIFWIRKEPLPFPKGQMALLTFRGLAGFGSLFCLFYSIEHLPLSVATMLSWCNLLFVIFFSRVFLGERLAKEYWIWIALAIGGLVVLLKPDFNQGFRTAFPLSATLIGVAGAAFSAAALMAVRVATAKVGVNTIIFYFVGVSTLLSAPMAVTHFTPPTPKQGFQLLFMGVSAAFAQFTMTQGYRHAPAGIVSVMSLLGAALSALFGWVLFSETLDPIQWCGLLVLATTLVRVALISRKS